MKIVIHVNGKTFESKDDDTNTAKEAKNIVYSQIELMDKLELDTENGHIVMGATALQNAVIEFIET